MIKAIDPQTGTNDGSVTIAITGTGFRNGIAAKLEHSGDQTVTASSAEVISATELNCTFDLTGQTEDTYSLTVTNDDGQTTTLADSFKIEQAAVASTEETPAATTEDRAGRKRPSLADLNASLKSIFFDFDKFNIRDDQAPITAADLSYLKR